MYPLSKLRLWLHSQRSNQFTDSGSVSVYVIYFDPLLFLQECSCKDLLLLTPRQAAKAKLLFLNTNSVAPFSILVVYAFYSGGFSAVR